MFDYADFLVRPPGVVLFVGISGSRKTTNILRFCENVDYACNTERKLVKLYLWYEIYQNAYDQIVSAMPDTCECIVEQGVPIDAINNPGSYFTTLNANQYQILIFDDCSTSLGSNKNFAGFLKSLCSIYVQHKSMLIFILLHDLYSSDNKALSFIRQNSHYIFLFGDGSQSQNIANLQRQFFSNYPGILAKIYHYIRDHLKSDYLSLDLRGNWDKILKCGLFLPNEDRYLVQLL